MYRYRDLCKIPNPFYKPGSFISSLLKVSLTQGNKGVWGKDQSFYPVGPIAGHWILEIKLGNGAGYKWGRTFFIARNALDPKASLHSGKRKLLSIGLTQNANLIPYSDGL